MIPLLIIAAVALFAIAGCWRSLRRAVDKHGIHVLAWRYATGAHMTAGRSHVCQPGQPCQAGRWAHLPRHYRAGLRLTGAGFVLACGYGMLADPAALADSLIMAGAGVIGWPSAVTAWWVMDRRRGAFVTIWRVRIGIAAGALALAAYGYGLASSPVLASESLGCWLALTGLTGLWLWRGASARWHKRTVIRPLAASLARTIAVSDADALATIKLPAAGIRRTRGELGSIALPDWYAGSPDQRKALDHLITSHLPVEVETSWQMAGRPKRVIISAAPSPPDVVPFAQVREQIGKLKPGQVLLGIDRRGEPYIGDFSGGDDPHWGFSVGSGRGKSTQLCSIGAQILRQDPGAGMVGIDPKMTSFEALAGVPGVELANDPRDMTGTGGTPIAQYPEIPLLWQAIRRYKAVMDDRIAAKKDDPTLEFPASLLFMDELNQFAVMSAGWWKDQGQKGTPPIWMDIAAVLWMGRFVNCHGILVGQRLDEKATGGVGLRDSLGLRGLGGFRANQWRMLVGTTPIPRSQKPRGRWIYSDGQDETWVQNVLMTPEETRGWALEGRRTAGDSVPVVPGTVVSSRIDAATGTGTADVWVIGLDAGAAHLGISAEAFKKRRFRAGGSIPGEYRKGNQPAWLAADLDAWSVSEREAV